jgi:hypothetical protein
MMPFPGSPAFVYGSPQQPVASPPQGWAGTPLPEMAPGRLLPAAGPSRAAGPPFQQASPSPGSSSRNNAIGRPLQPSSFDTSLGSFQRGTAAPNQATQERSMVEEGGQARSTKEHCAFFLKTGTCAYGNR